MWQSISPTEVFAPLVKRTISHYAQVCQAADDAGMVVADGVEFYIQYGSGIVKDLAVKNGWHSFC